MRIVSGPAPLALRTSGPEQTRSMGRALARLCAPGDMVLLAGGLGAGKTTFAQGFGAGLGITEPITSPTFTLVRHYPVTGPAGGAGNPDRVRTLLHADVYRLDRVHEIVDLGLGQLVEDGGVALVEWGDVAGPVLGEGSLTVALSAEGEDDDRRSISVRAVGSAWASRWAALRDGLSPWRVAA